MINQQTLEKQVSLKPPVSVVLTESDWEYRLDLLGMNANIADLQAHLDAAPNPESSTATYLKGFIGHATVISS